MREKPLEERVTEHEEALAELRSLITEAREVLSRIESYEADLQWLRNERRKAR